MEPGQVDVDWDDGQWLNPPVATKRVDKVLAVTAVEESDFWRTTSYGFVHDTGHALLRPFPIGEAIEVSFVLDYDQQFDQAGVLVRASWQLVRVAPWPRGSATSAGPYCCAPTRSGLEVRFSRWLSGPSDAALHSD